MKKFIAMLLLLTLSLGLFAGCVGGSETTGPDAAAALASAKEYLYAMYKDDATTTPSNYSRVGTVLIQDVGSFDVTWTASDASITVTPDGKMVNITVPEHPEAEIAYKLIATIKDAAGNTTTVEFNYVIPAAAGKPGELKDGTYVITNGKVTMGSLAADKGYGYPAGTEVTITDGKVSGHTADDVLTIKNVEGGITIQDAHGRYFYLKGDYNSFNVDATAPAEGHIWEILVDGDNVMLVNKLNKKILAYSAGYSSWGAYPELTDDHTSALVIVAATAPEGGNPGGDTTDPAAEPEFVKTPEVGKVYKLGLFQKNKGEALYFNGDVYKPEYPWYLGTTNDASAGADVYLEAVEGGYYLYYMKGDVKTYIDIYKSGTHNSLQLIDTPETVLTWDATNSTLSGTLPDGTVCCMGTNGTYTSISCNTYEGEVFYCHLYEVK